MSLFSRAHDILGKLADRCPPERLKLTADKVVGDIRQGSFIIGRRCVDERPRGPDKVPGQPARQGCRTPERSPLARTGSSA